MIRAYCSTAVVGVAVAASANQDPEIVALLLDSSADLEARDQFGRPPLHNATRNNKNPAIAELPLYRGTDLNSRTTTSKPLGIVPKTTMHWREPRSIGASIVCGSIDGSELVLLEQQGHIAR